MPDDPVTPDYAAKPKHSPLPEGDAMPDDPNTGSEKPALDLPALRRLAQRALSAWRAWKDAPEGELQERAFWTAALWRDRLGYACEATIVLALLDRVASAEAAQRCVDALRELVVVAELRGDNELPHPADDAKLWTARMQEAWGDAEAAIGAFDLRARVTAPSKEAGDA